MSNNNDTKLNEFGFLLKNANYNTTTNNLELHYDNVIDNKEETILIDINTLTSNSDELNYTDYSNEALDKVFNAVCDEYGKRLCEKYDWDFNDCFWVADLRAGTFCTSDIEYSLSLEEVKLLVDENVPFNDFVKWWDYNYRMHLAIYNNPNDKDLHGVNLWTWLKGYHGDKDDEWLEKQANLYWKNISSKEFEDEQID